MIVRTKEDLKGTKGEVRTENWSSCRFPHKQDGMGVTLTDAILEPGLDQVFWSKNHLEAVYCLEGEGTLEDLATGKSYLIKPGTLYGLSKYHETIARAWIMAVRHFMENAQDSESSDIFIEKNPRMLDSKIMLAHYSAEVLFSDEARAKFMEPNLDPIPEYGR